MALHATCQAWKPCGPSTCGQLAAWPYPVGPHRVASVGHVFALEFFTQKTAALSHSKHRQSQQGLFAPSIRSLAFLLEEGVHHIPPSIGAFLAVQEE